jgi:hypothetical protein
MIRQIIKDTSNKEGYAGAPWIVKVGILCEDEIGLL